MSTGDARLGLALYDAGLLQFGRFVTDEGPRPFQHHLAMLASYPALLGALAESVAPFLDGVDRLICTENSVALGVSGSLQSQVPLVIARGNGHDGARDFVGAYDIGHPAALIANSLSEIDVALIARAAVWGLQVRSVVAVLDLGGRPASVPSTALVDLEALIALLIRERNLPDPLATAMLAWLK